MGSDSVEDKEKPDDGEPHSTDREPKAELSSSYTSAERGEVADGSQNDGDEEPGLQLEPGVEHKEKTRFNLIAAEEPIERIDKVLRHVAILSLLVFASIWGTLAREGLIALNTYSGMSITPTIWAQSVGCLIMGWNIANREALEVWYPPMYTAIGTGFCGSVTTFSAWILEVFEAFGNKQHYDRHGLHNVMDALTQTAATLGMSIVSISAGVALAKVLPARPLLHILDRRIKLNQRQRTSGEENPKPKDKVPYSKISDVIAIAIGVLFWAASAILCGTYSPFRAVTFAIVFSPPGAILRWYLSRLNSAPRSTHSPHWPLGTLAANLLATVVIAAVFVAQNVGRVSGRGGGGAYSITGCHALYGVQQGFCGCLSTISTFVVELKNLKPKRRAVSYAVGSWVIGIIICVLIIGSPWWSIGMDGSCNDFTL